MKTIQELEKIIQEEEKKVEEEGGLMEFSMHNLLYEELKSQNDTALNMWLDIMVDYCNNWDERFEFFYDMMYAMVEDGYKPTCNLFAYHLADTIRDNGKIKYIPSDENEMNEVLDIYGRYEKMSNDINKEMFEKYGVIWDSLTVDERMYYMMKSIQDSDDKL